MGNGQGLILRNVSTKNTRKFVSSWRRQLVSWTTPLGMFKLKRILEIGSLDLRVVWWGGGQIWFLSPLQTGNVCDQTRSNVVKHFVRWTVIKRAWYHVTTRRNIVVFGHQTNISGLERAFRVRPFVMVWISHSGHGESKKMMIPLWVRTRRFLCYAKIMHSDDGSMIQVITTQKECILNLGLIARASQAGDPQVNSFTIWCDLSL